MTAGHLLFAAGMTAYMLVAVVFEERDLIAHFGRQYEEYRRRVPMFIPWRGELKNCLGVGHSGTLQFGDGAEFMPAGSIGHQIQPLEISERVSLTDLNRSIHLTKANTRLAPGTPDAIIPSGTPAARRSSPR